MTVRELREKVRQLTREVNVGIAEYWNKFGNSRPDKTFERFLNKLKKNTGVERGYEGGYLGLGTSRKTKLELERQLIDLEAFKEKEWWSDEKRAMYKQRGDAAYRTFVNRYGAMDYMDWISFVGNIQLMRDKLIQFGYESVQGAVASLYGESDDKESFFKILDQAMTDLSGKGATGEMFVDHVADLLVEEGHIPDQEEGY